MKKIVITSLLFLVIAVPTLCTAAPVQPGMYFTGFGGATFPRSVDITGVDVGLPFNEHTKFNTGYYVGGALGYDFGFVRFEAEASYKNADLRSVTDNFTGVPFGDPTGRLGAFAAMGNLFFDLHNPTMITPYIGGGAGVAVLDMRHTSALDLTTGAPIIPLYPDDRDTVFAYQGGAGLDLALTRNFSLDLGYRYFGTAKASFNQIVPISGGAGPLSAGMKFESHNALLGFKFKF